MCGGEGVVLTLGLHLLKLMSMLIVLSCPFLFPMIPQSLNILAKVLPSISTNPLFAGPALVSQKLRKASSSPG